MNPTKPMQSQDLAAFIAMLFWMRDPAQADNQFYNVYRNAAAGQLAQFDGIQTAINNNTLPNTRLFANWNAINTDPVIGPNITAAQQAIGAVLQSLGGLWDGCASVSVAQVAAIAQMP